MKELIGSIFKAGAAKIIITFGLGIGVAFYVSNNIIKHQIESKEAISEIRKQTQMNTDILQKEIIPILNHIHATADSANINSKKALEIGKINIKCNIEMSKQLKGFDILKFYDPFMWLNRQDTSLKKKNLSNPMYAGKL